MLYECAQHVFQHGILVFRICVHILDLRCELDQHLTHSTNHEGPTL